MQLPKRQTLFLENYSSLDITIKYELPEADSLWMMFQQTVYIKTKVYQYTSKELQD